MNVTSLGYAAFLAITLAAYYTSTPRLRPGLLLIASYGFYATFSLPYLVLLLAVTALTIAGGRVLARVPRPSLLAILLLLLVIPLLAFKYWPLLEMFVPGSVTPVRLLVPVGISFYTFRALGYVIDVYRAREPVSRSAVNVALLVGFFPLALAGPIERAGGLLLQLARLARPRLDQVVRGLKLLLIGAFCKLVLADNLGVVVDATFDQHTVASGAALGCALALFSLQIYYDFFGYTQMALGAGSLFGISLSENFDRPYLATSFRQFWHRWHITLSSWFRDYLYIPLGGNRRSGWRQALAVLLVFGISGLWHGAALGFLFWGLLHGMYYLLERALAPLGRPLKLSTTAGRTLRGLFVFASVSLAWLPFRIPDLRIVLRIARTILGGWTEPGWWNLATLTTPMLPALLLLVGTVFALEVTIDLWRQLTAPPTRLRHHAVQLGAFDAIALLLLLTSLAGPQEFLYARF